MQLTLLINNLKKYSLKIYLDIVFKKTLFFLDDHLPKY